MAGRPEGGGAANRRAGILNAGYPPPPRPPRARLRRRPRRRRLRRPVGGSRVRSVGRGRGVRRLSRPHRPLHPVAGRAVDAAVGRAGDPRRTRAVAPPVLSRPLADPRPVRRAARPAGDRRRARRAGAVGPRRPVRAADGLALGRRLAGHLRAGRHPRRPCLLQPAARRPPAAGGAGGGAARPLAPVGPARHGRPRQLPADRMAGDARRPAGRRRARLHAVRHLLHHRADARRRPGRHHA